MANRNGIRIILLLASYSVLCYSARAQSDISLTNLSVYKKLDSTCRTPDALAFDREGNVYLSITNATTYDMYGSKIVKMDHKGHVIWTFADLPKHPLTKKVFPMGMGFDDSGNLYIADNQIFAGETFQSRVLKATIKDGNISQVTPVVTGLNIANGLRVYKGSVFVTDPKTDNNRKSGVYSFFISELSNSISINDSNRKKYLVYEMSLDDHIADGVGIDGLDFDENGKLYVGNFSNGSVTKIELTASGKLKRSQKVSDTMLIGCDGLIFDKRSNSLLITNFLQNSILKYDLTSGKISNLWSNSDAQCTADLDCPADLAFYNGKLVIVNFDSYTTPANKTIDNCNTLSVFEVVRH